MNIGKVVVVQILLWGLLIALNYQFFPSYAGIHLLCCACLYLTVIVVLGETKKTASKLLDFCILLGIFSVWSLIFMLAIAIIPPAQTQLLVRHCWFLGAIGILMGYLFSKLIVV